MPRDKMNAEKWRLNYRSKAAKAAARWREKYPDKAKSTALKANRKRAASLHDLKNLPCEDCGKKYSHYIMEFDHVPERAPKNFNISHWGRKSQYTYENLLNELFTCDLVCANCHRARTYIRSRKRG